MTDLCFKSCFGRLLKLFRMLTVVLLTVGIAACGGQKFVDPGEEAAAASKNTEVFKIGVEDVLQINVWRNPDLSVSAPVRPDGKISVPLVGDVQAGGLTPTEVGDSIKQKLAVFIRDPNVTVILTNLRSAEFISRIRVTGAVRVQKSMPYRQGMTVLDAVLEAGGLNDFASANRTKLYRKKNLKTEVYSIDLGDILNKGKLDTNATLRPGDIITVPERLF